MTSRYEALGTLGKPRVPTLGGSDADVSVPPGAEAALRLPGGPSEAVDDVRRVELELLHHLHESAQIRERLLTQALEHRGMYPEIRQFLDVPAAVFSSGVHRELNRAGHHLVPEFLAHDAADASRVLEAGELDGERELDTLDEVLDGEFVAAAAGNLEYRLRRQVLDQAQEVGVEMADGDEPQLRVLAEERGLKGLDLWGAETGLDGNGRGVHLDGHILIIGERVGGILEGEVFDGFGGHEVTPSEQVELPTVLPFGAVNSVANYF